MATKLALTENYRSAVKGAQAREEQTLIDAMTKIIGQQIRIVHKVVCVNGIVTNAGYGKAAPVEGVVAGIEHEEMMCNPFHFVVVFEDSRRVYFFPGEEDIEIVE